MNKMKTENEQVYKRDSKVNPLSQKAWVYYLGLESRVLKFYSDYSEGRIPLKNLEFALEGLSRHTARPKA